MTARILDGTATLRTIKAELAERVAKLAERGATPGLGTVLVGDDPGSHWYVGAKHKDCASIGITSIRRDLPATATQAEVEAVIDELNADPACTGAARPRRGRACRGWSGAGRRRPCPGRPGRAGRTRRARWAAGR